MNLRAFSALQWGMLIFVALLVLLHLLPESFRSVLEYHRAEPEQLWRALTGHFLHSNHWHLVMNLGALLLMLMLPLWMMGILAQGHQVLVQDVEVQQAAQSDNPSNTEDEAAETQDNPSIDENESHLHQSSH